MEPVPSENTSSSPSSDTVTSTTEPLVQRPSRICSDSGSSSMRWMARRKGRAPKAVSVPSLATRRLAASSRLMVMFWAIMRSRSSATMRSTICTISSSVRLLNTMISSIRFKNSGLKAFFSSCMTRLLISLSESPFCPEFEKPSVVVVVMSRAPTFDVMMMTVLRKSTVRPWASVRRPSSRICSRMLNTSGCAFSISSKSTTEYGRWRTALVSWPPSSKPT